MLHVMIMAGGAGTRFWPESRAARPKQLLALAGQRSMLQMTVDRLGELAGERNLWVLTNAALVDAVAEQLPRVARTQVLGEPCKRDTAPCIGLAALLISELDPDATLAVMPADHVIEPAGAFQRSIRDAAAIVEKDNEAIATFGIKPTYPATCFGYIERGEPLAPGVNAYRVARFREKPPLAVAQEYQESGRFYWNSGVFVWKASTILDALRARQPEMVAHLQTIAEARGRTDFDKVFAREFAAIRGISIDYAVMEHARNVVVIEAPFTWDDVGAWQAVARLGKPDDAGNTVAGRYLGIDTSNSIIRSGDDHLIATVGVSDLIVVHTPDATLVANRHDEESIRRLVKLLEERGWTEYL